MHGLYTRTAIARFLLVLWGLICLNNVVFRHAHRLADGRIITHAHPYLSFAAKCPYPAHQHTKSELAWLDCISNAQFDTPAPTLVWPESLVWLAPRLTYSYVETDGSYRFHWFFLRGPPCRVY